MRAKHLGRGACIRVLMSFTMRVAHFGSKRWARRVLAVNDESRALLIEASGAIRLAGAELIWKTNFLDEHFLDEHLSSEHFLDEYFPGKHFLDERFG